MDKLKETARRAVVALLAGFGVGAVIAWFAAPHIIVWYSTPAVPTPAMCTETVGWAIDRFRTSLAVSAGVGGLLAVIAVEITRALRGKKTEV